MRDLKIPLSNDILTATNAAMEILNVTESAVWENKLTASQKKALVSARKLAAKAHKELESILDSI